MIYAAVVVAVLAALFIKSIYDEKKHYRDLCYAMERDWGRVPKEEYSSEKYKSLQFYFDHLPKIPGQIDEITWNDLDMDQIFMTMNNTGSASGEEYLFALLHRPCYDEAELAERERLIRHFSEDKSARQALQIEFLKMGKERNISIFEYMHLLHNLKREDNSPHYLRMIAMFAAIVYIAIQPFIGIMATVLVSVFNALAYYRRKMQIEKYFISVSHLIRMMDGMKVLSETNDEAIREYAERTKEVLKVFKSFRKGARVIAPKDPTGNLAEGFIDYLRMMFHFDLIKFNNMLSVFDKHETELKEMFEIAGFLDSMIAIASFRELMQDWAVPELINIKDTDDKPFIEATAVYHPMLDEPVKADINEHISVLLTGSNASGKSTFIKTMAINAILAQTAHTVMADSYRSCYFYTATSMALRDDLSSSESYYIVEIKSLKRILDMLNDEIPVLCFVDEVLRGTNTIERIAASTEILTCFANGNAMCFAATHDIELTSILADKFSNYHFQEYIEDDQVLFDYKLQKGPATSRNAIKLLSMLGYEKDITEKAEARAKRFEECGEWK